MAQIGLMKKTLHIDEALLAEARAASGARTDTETVRLGLEALLRSAAYERMRSLLGSERAVKDVPRRREGAKRKRRRSGTRPDCDQRRLPQHDRQQAAWDRVWPSAASPVARATHAGGAGRVRGAVAFVAWLAPFS
jgi:Arc/MetJ family transcription regulator